jgi:pyrimidine-nucleoside phosphorylase
MSMDGPVSMAELIERKKVGAELTRDEIAWICREYADGRVPDYQIAAWLMAVRWRGMTESETYWLTEALVASGQTLRWPTDRPVVDKHSTGGVGDKTSIALVPLLASAGLTFVKMSGRGLAHTGGTLDKLEAIPGFRVNLSLEEIRRQVDRIGCAMVGQTPELVPADAAIYALRDVTSTIDSVPLIASSVMAKKLAAGAPSIVLDVKYGRGALLAERAEAEELATVMVRIGSGAGRRVRALLSRMDEPLGMAVGNALEVEEAIECLKGGGPPDLRELIVELGAHLMVMSRVTGSLDDARGGLRRLLDGGLGADHLEKLIEAQGGDPRVVGDPSLLPVAPVRVVVESDETGWVAETDARAVANAVLALGGGRRRKGEPIDHRTGVRLLVKSGHRVESGQPIVELHAATEDSARNAVDGLRRGIRITLRPEEAVDQGLTLIAGVE